MQLNRRNFVEMTAGAGLLSILPGCKSSPGKPRAGSHDRQVSLAELEKAAEAPVLDLDGVDSPLVIESIELLRKGREYILRVRSKDGAEGVAIPNSRPDYLAPILNKRVIPYFIGKDARLLEAHLFDVYRFRSNYKLQGLALWCPVAWVEFALLDMIGRVSGKSFGRLLGGVVRRKVPFYIASGRRDSTPEEEAEYLAKLVADTGAKAVKFRVGGRMSKNADSMPGRSEKLIGLSRKRLGDDIDIHADANSSYDPPKARCGLFRGALPLRPFRRHEKSRRCLNDPRGRRRAGIQPAAFSLGDLQPRRGYRPAGPAILRRADSFDACRADGGPGGDADNRTYFRRLRFRLHAAFRFFHAGHRCVPGIQERNPEIQQLVRSASGNQERLDHSSPGARCRY